MTEHWTLERYETAVDSTDEVRTFTSHAPNLADLTDMVVEAQEALPEEYNSIETRRLFRAFLQELWLEGLEANTQADPLFIQAVGQPLRTYVVKRHADIVESAENQTLTSV